LLESLVLFAALVLAAVVAGKTNAMTALGAQLFFWARLAYAIVYLAGVPWVRTGVWLVCDHRPDPDFCAAAVGAPDRFSWA